MARYEHLPIYKKALDLTIYFEEIVRHFSRYHKYTLGTELREKSREIVGFIIKANSTVERLALLLELRERLEGLKVLVRICKEVKAFHNFNSFEYAITMLPGVGWIKPVLSMRRAKRIHNFIKMLLVDTAQKTAPLSTLHLNAEGRMKADYKGLRRERSVERSELRVKSMRCENSPSQ